MHFSTFLGAILALPALSVAVPLEAREANKCTKGLPFEQVCDGNTQRVCVGGRVVFSRDCENCLISDISGGQVVLCPSAGEVNPDPTVPGGPIVPGNPTISAIDSTITFG